METIGDRIHQARKLRGLTQATLATQVGVSKQSATYWESKSKPNVPEPHRVAKIAEILAVRVDWLLTGKAPMTEDPEQPPIAGSVLNRALMYRVIVALERYFVEHASDMTPEDKGEVALAVYDWAEAEGGPDSIDIARIASLLRLAHPRRRPR